MPPRRGVQNSILERGGPPSFEVAIEMIARSKWRVHMDVGQVSCGVCVGMFAHGFLLMSVCICVCASVCLYLLSLLSLKDVAGNLQDSTLFRGFTKAHGYFAWAVVQITCLCISIQAQQTRPGNTILTCTSICEELTHTTIQAQAYTHKHTYTYTHKHRQ